MEMKPTFLAASMASACAMLSKAQTVNATNIANSALSQALVRDVKLSIDSSCDGHL